MFIKRGDRLQPGCTVVKLVKQQPQHMRVMAHPVPPVKYKSNDQIRYESQDEIRIALYDIGLMRFEPYIPGRHTQNDDPKLHKINHDHSGPPTFDQRQDPIGEDTFEYDKYKT